MNACVQVPNLFAKDELAMIMEAVTNRAKKAGRPLTPSGLYQFFVDECRANLHLVLAFSPVGGAFRARLRMFPSLVNCCTIDWFSEWPDDALKSVARHFLAEVRRIQNIGITRPGHPEFMISMQVWIHVVLHSFRDHICWPLST